MNLLVDMKHLSDMNVSLEQSKEEKYTFISILSRAREVGITVSDPLEDDLTDDEEDDEDEDEVDEDQEDFNSEESVSRKRIVSKVW